MQITKLFLENFKSFGRIELEFGKVNLLIGANASGKSNFIQVFEFLKNIQKIGLRQAVAEAGGIRILKNLNVNAGSFTIQLQMRLNDTFTRNKIGNNVYIVRVKDTADYAITFTQKGNNNFSIREKITFNEHFAEFDETDSEIKRLGKPLQYGIENRFGKFETFTDDLTRQQDTLSNGEKVDLFIENPFHERFIGELNASYGEKSVLEYPGVFIPRNLFDFGIFETDPKKVKIPAKDTYTNVLNKDASNLAVVINQILNQDEETREQFLANVSAALNFVENIKVDKIENELHLKVQEMYNKNMSPSRLLSNGTIAIIALITALYHQNYNVYIFEEPEIGVHPHLLAYLAGNFYDAATYKDKQIFITTHSPELLRLIYQQNHLNDIYLMSRENSYSVIDKPQNKAMVNIFLRNEIGIEELFIQNLLAD